MNDSNRQSDEKTGVSRRSRYVVHACDECRRRKVKCNGEEPCCECASHSTPCSYRLQSKRRRHGTSLPQCGNVSTRKLRPDTFAKTSQTPTSHDFAETQSLEGTQPAEFHGLSSSQYTLSVVNGNLKDMGINEAICDASAPTFDCTENGLSRLARHNPFMQSLLSDPLWDWKLSDALPLMDRYFTTIGVLYPAIDATRMRTTAHVVFKNLEEAKRGNSNDSIICAAQSISKNETNRLKVIIAIGKAMQCGGKSEESQRLVSSVSKVVDALLWDPDGIDGIQLLLLSAIYQYHIGEEACAGRFVALAARLCIEIGLHRREMVASTFQNDEDRASAIKTFCSVYIFERRTSLGQGIPSLLQDTHIDQSLFAADLCGSLLLTMIDWTRLAGKTWEALNAQVEKGSTISRDDIEFLDYQILQWYDKLPGHAKLASVGSEFCTITQDFPECADGVDPLYITAVLYLRKSHLRNLIYRLVLSSSVRVAQHRHLALTAVQIAKEAVQILFNIEQRTALLASQQIFFAHLLLVAFGNLLLAVVNSMSDYWDIVREDFYTALGLIRRMSTRSVPLMRLWRRIRGLEDLQSKLLAIQNSGGVTSNGQEHEALRATAATHPYCDSRSTSTIAPSLVQEDLTADYLAMESSQLRGEFASLFDGLESDTYSNFPFADFTNSL